MSITLTSQEQFSVGGTPIETNTIAGVTGFTVDYIASTLTFNAATGALASGNIRVSGRGTQVVDVINLVTGVCQVNNQTVGTLGAGALSTLNGFLKMPGTIWKMWR